MIAENWLVSDCHFKMIAENHVWKNVWNWTCVFDQAAAIQRIHRPLQTKNIREYGVQQP